MQRATWAEYKHHNTVKSLICVSPNSGITSISKACTGRLDQKSTLESGFLDHIPQFTTIMADLDFNLIDKCTRRNIHFEIPQQKRNNSDDTSSAKQDLSTAKVCILVEQVIRHLKTFKIFSNEIPTSLLKLVNGMFIVCAVICNFKEQL